MDQATTEPLVLRPAAAADGARTRTEDIRRRLADDIITGRIAPGARLDETVLARRFGVSRTPVREALKHLAAIGLAEPGPYRSQVAAGIGPQKLAELFEVMGELEGTCARLAAQRMTPAERRQLEALHGRSAQVMARGHPADYDDMNTQFHTTLYRGSHNSQLEEMALSVRARLAPFRGGQFNVLGRLAKSFAEHDRVVTAILRGDGIGAQLAMLNHVEAVGHASADYVAGRARRAFMPRERD